VGKLVRRLVSVSLVLLLGTLSFLFTIQDCHASTVVRLDPDIVVLGFGKTFTLELKIDDVTELYSMGLKIKWNTTLFEYINHVAKVPVETFSDGVLHEPLALVIDFANTTTGTYYLAVTSLFSAPAFTGSGIAFEITLRTRFQTIPPETNITSSIVFLRDDMADMDMVIYHYTYDCEVTLIRFIPADVNYDWIVDIGDLVLCASSYGATPLDPNWNSDCDLAEPYGIIDIFDIVTVASHYGEEYIP
jgi:hypothetical protein